MEKIELPFVVGVLADLSGNPALPRPRLQDRRFVDLIPDNFDAVLEQAAPRLVLRVPDRLRAGTGELEVELRFRALPDFGPDSVVEQVAPLKALLEARPNSGDTSDRDLELSEQLNEVLHHPDFQKLEATWRGLKYLLDQAQTGPLLKIRVLNASKEDLVQDFRRAVDFDQSRLFQKVYEEEFGCLGGQPYGILIGDYEFDRGSEDMALLQHLSRIAAASHAPFVAAASPGLFNFKSWNKLAEPRALAPGFEGGEYARWKSFRESEDSRYVALTLPRVLSRLPYGPKSRAVARFNFEESIDGKDHDKYLWMSAVWAYAACVTNAFARHGWLAATRGAENGGKIEGVPVHRFPSADGAAVVKRPAETSISDRREYELSDLGFLPLQHWEDRDFAAFMDTRSCHKPKVHDRPEATTREHDACMLNLVLCASRFFRNIKVMARDMIGRFMGVGDCEMWLNRWISLYVNATPEDVGPEARARKPLREARIEVRETVGRPGHYEAIVSLWPHYQFEGPIAGLIETVYLPAPRYRGG
jgi:type VI secretion system protein ImpC